MQQAAILACQDEDDGGGGGANFGVDQEGNPDQKESEKAI